MEQVKRQIYPNGSKSNNNISNTTASKQNHIRLKGGIVLMLSKLKSCFGYMKSSLFSLAKCHFIQYLHETDMINRPLLWVFCQCKKLLMQQDIFYSIQVNIKPITA